jgi:hypothetical protein
MMTPAAPLEQESKFVGFGLTYLLLISGISVLIGSQNVVSGWPVVTVVIRLSEVIIASAVMWRVTF